jgi:hypothetical protein
VRKRSSFLATFDNSSNDWGGYTIRQVIPAAQLSLSGGTVSIRIAALAGSTVTISECWIDHSASSGSSNADFAGTPTRVTFAGANGATTPSGGMVESDLVPFVLDETEDLVVSMYIPAGAGQNFRAVASMADAVAKYTNSNAADDPGAVTSGWSASGLDVVGVAGVSIGQSGIQLYDDIFGTAPIKGAWGLRKLVSTYTGPLIRIRDTDDDSEQDVGFNGAGKLDRFEFMTNLAVTTLFKQQRGASLPCQLRHAAMLPLTSTMLMTAFTARQRGPPVLTWWPIPFLCSEWVAVLRLQPTLRLSRSQMLTGATVRRTIDSLLSATLQPI